MSDYSILAQRISVSLPGIRGCLLLSRDGMVLGAHPEGPAEAAVKSAWVRFAALGDVEQSHVEFADQTWAFVRRGGYAAFAVADAGVRPGVLVDLLEQALMAGEQERVHDRETMRLPEAASAPSGKPRTSLHKPERAPAQATEATPAAPVAATPEVADAEEHVPEDHAEPAAEAEEAPSAPRPERASGDEETEVDRILLAKEFAGLLQVPKEDDEATR